MNAKKSFDISKQLVMEAYKAVKSNAGAGGIDEQSIEDFERDGHLSNVQSSPQRMDGILWKIQSIIHECDVQTFQQHDQSVGYAEIQESQPAKTVGYLLHREDS